MYDFVLQNWYTSTVGRVMQSRVSLSIYHSDIFMEVYKYMYVSVRICMHNKCTSPPRPPRPQHTHTFSPFLSRSQALLWFCLSTASNSIEERRSSWRRHGIFTIAFRVRCGLPRPIGTIWKWILIRYYPSICESGLYICVNVFVCERVRVCTFGGFFLANSLLNCSFSATRWKLWEYFTFKAAL